MRLLHKLLLCTALCLAVGAGFFAFHASPAYADAAGDPGGLAAGCQSSYHTVFAIYPGDSSGNFSASTDSSGKLNIWTETYYCGGGANPPHSIKIGQYTGGYCNGPSCTEASGTFTASLGTGASFNSGFNYGPFGLGDIDPGCSGSGCAGGRYVNAYVGSISVSTATCASVSFKYGGSSHYGSNDISSNGTFTSPSYNVCNNNPPVGKMTLACDPAGGKVDFAQTGVTAGYQFAVDDANQAIGTNVGNPSPATFTPGSVASGWYTATTGSGGFGYNTYHSWNIKYMDLVVLNAAGDYVISDHKALIDPATCPSADNRPAGSIGFTCNDSNNKPEVYGTAWDPDDPGSASNRAAGSYVKVTLYANGALLATVTANQQEPGFSPPANHYHEYTYEPPSTGTDGVTYTAYAQSIDASGNNVGSPQVLVTYGTTTPVSVTAGPCDHLPALSASATCAAGFKLSATDADDTTTPASSRKVRIDVYEDHDASTYTATSAPYRQYTTYSTAGATVNVTLADLELGNTGSAGIGYPPGTPASHPGRSTDWASHTFYIYAMSVNSSGVEVGSNTEQIKTVGPCAIITCAPGQTTFPSTFEANISTPSFVVAVKATGVTSAPPAAAPGFGVTVHEGSVTGPAVQTTPQTISPPRLVPYDSGSTTILSQQIKFTPPDPNTTYYLTWGWGYATSGHTLSNATTNSTATTQLCPASSPTSGTTVTKPYFNVLGGDVTAGSGFSTTAGSCTQLTSGVKSWNNDGGPDHTGAGSQLATFSLGNITSFATSINTSGGLSNVGTPTPGPQNLSFANSPTPPVNVNDSAGQYGGGFGYLPCIKDYYTQTYPKDPHPSTATNVDLSTFTTSGIYSYSGSINLGGTLNPGLNVQLAVNGNVVVTGNVRYAASYDLTNVPSLDVYAKGNISVDHSVGTMHGLYVAKLTFATCANATVETTAFDTCNNPLTIYGSVLANQIDFDRTFGSLNAGAGPAESIRYTPELWLPNTSGTATLDCSPNCNYESITSLPPVL